MEQVILHGTKLFFTYRHTYIHTEPKIFTLSKTCSFKLNLDLRLRILQKISSVINAWFESMAHRSLYPQN